MVPNMAYKPPIMLGGLKDPIWDKYIKHEGTRKDPIEGHQKISNGQQKIYIKDNKKIP